MGFLRGDADVLVCDEHHRVGHRHPAGQHADRRALRPLRPRPALPDPRPRRPFARARLRVPALPERGGADARGGRSGCRALSDYTELGAGFKIAMRDLELRGAGNLLGDEQSGHVAALGFELYMQMLDEAVRGSSRRRRRRRCRAGPPRRQRRRLRAGRLRALRAGEDRRAPPRSPARATSPSWRSCATSWRTASGPVPSRSRTCSPSSGRASSSARRARGPSRFRGGRLAVTPIELDSVAARSLRDADPRRRSTSRAAPSSPSASRTIRPSASRRWCGRRMRCSRGLRGGLGRRSVGQVDNTVVVGVRSGQRQLLGPTSSGKSRGPDPRVSGKTNRCSPSTRPSASIARTSMPLPLT